MTWIFITISLNNSSVVQYWFVVIILCTQVIEKKYLKKPKKKYRLFESKIVYRENRVVEHPHIFKKWIRINKCVFYATKHKLQRHILLPNFFCKRGFPFKSFHLYIFSFYIHFTCGEFSTDPLDKKILIEGCLFMIIPWKF